MSAGEQERPAERETHGRPTMLHAFTVDVEDWCDGIPIPEATRASAERRLQHGMGILLDAMAARSTKGTFFFLGPVARENAELVKRLAADGHELGCHGWSHDLLYEMTPGRLRRETGDAKKAIEDIAGRPVTSYRAAYFSITRRNLWALETLVELGFRCDSSIFPVRNWRYGIPDYDPTPRFVTTPAGPIFEFPLSVVRYPGRQLPATGGAYFRIYPYAVTRAHVRRLERASTPVVFYIHPWELDPDHPRVPFALKPRVTHYWSLRSTRSRLDRLLSEFPFVPLGKVMEHESDRHRS